MESKGLEMVNNIRLSTLNARLVKKNKDLIIGQKLNDHKIDITVITESWLKESPEDEAWTNQSELIQRKYNVKLHNRPWPKKGGRIALTHKNQYPVQELEKGNITTIKYAVMKVEIRNRSLQINGIYHPPPNTQDNSTNNMFLDEITELLTSPIPKYNNLIIMGDFNMHIDHITNLENQIFNDTMEALGLSQQVRTPTHKQGNILDLIYIEDNSQLKYRNCQTHGFISDHAIVTKDMYLLKDKPKLTTKKICNNKRVTKEALIQNFKPPTIERKTGLSQAYNQLKTKLQEILEKTATEKTIKVYDKPKQPCFSKYIWEQRKSC